MSSHLQLTNRMCVRLQAIHVDDDLTGISNSTWETLRTTLQTGARSKTGTRIDLTWYSEAGLHHLLRLLKILEQKTAHKQVGEALRARINTLNNHLGISAVDRLGELM